MRAPGAIPSIEALRALACLMVVFCHLVGRPTIVYGVPWFPHTLIDAYLLAPLGVIQNFGFLGVAVFFLISGFIITHTGVNESRVSFIVKRAFRIYPALIAVVFATVLLSIVCERVGWTDRALGVGHTGAVLSALGIDVFFTPVAVLGVGWTITIELMFYSVFVIALPLFKNRPIISVLYVLLVSILMMKVFSYAAPKGEKPFGIAATLSAYIPIFAIGVSIYYGWAGRMSVRVAGLLSVISWVVFVYCISKMQPLNVRPGNSFPTQVTYAIGIFLGVLWFIRGDVENARVARFYSDISYSLYLLHVPFGVATTMLLYPRFGMTVAVLVSFVTVTFISWASFRVVEQPGRRLGRWMLTRTQKQSMAVEVDSIVQPTVVMGSKPSG